MTTPDPQHGGARPGAGRPSIDPEGKPVQIAIRLPSSLLALIDAEAERRGLTRNEMARQVLSRWASRQKKS